MSINVKWEKLRSESPWGRRSKFAYFLFDNKMWIVGGSVDGVHRNDVWNSTDGITWNLIIANASWKARMSAGFAVHDKKMWISGGQIPSGATNDVWSSSDGVNWKQSTTEASWGGRWGHGMVSFKNKLWVVSGHCPFFCWSPDIWNSEDGKTWNLVTSLAPWVYNAYGRDDFVCTVFDNKIWIYGGQSGNDYLADVWNSEDGYTWVNVRNDAMVGNRKTTAHLTTSDSFDNKIWVFGGEKQKVLVSGTISPDLNGVYERVGLSLLNNKAYYKNTQGNGYLYYKEVSGQKNWYVSMAADTPGANHYKNSILPSTNDPVVLDNPYNPIGATGTGLTSNFHENDSWYTSDGVIWNEAPNAGLEWDKRTDHGSVSLNGNFYLFGGEGNDEMQLSDVWIGLFEPRMKIPIINQNHYNMIPFTWVGEKGLESNLGDASVIQFKIQGKNDSYLDYSNILSGNNGSISLQSGLVGDTYVPERDSVRNVHQSTHYVDIIASDNSGLKDVRVSAFPDQYEFEAVSEIKDGVESIFMVPKFSWTYESMNPVVVNATTTTTTTESNKTIDVIYPDGGEEILMGSSQAIKWTSTKGTSENVRIDLYNRGALVLNIVESASNTGEYSWASVPITLDAGENYRVVITWLSSGTQFRDYSNDEFSIVYTSTATTTTTSPTTTTTTTLNFESSNVSSEVVEEFVTIQGKYDGIFWVGTQYGQLIEVEYTNSEAKIGYSNTFGSQVNDILMIPEENKMYVSTNENLYIYSISDYANVSSRELVAQVSNLSTNSVDYYDSFSDTVWGIQAYNGKVVKMNRNTLEVITEYKGFDAPFKVARSEYHGLYFVSGTHSLWTINDSTGQITTIYSVSDCSIADFDLASTGEICLLLNGEFDGYMRVLDIDLYSILLNEKINNATVRFCKYCNNGRFYMLAELISNNETYSTYNFVYSIDTDILEKSMSSSEIALTTSTTSTSTHGGSGDVDVVKPSAGESIELGRTYKIKWTSSKSISDLVKIELFREGSFAQIIEERIANTGEYYWEVSEDFDIDDNYQINVTWLSASSNPENSSISGNFAFVAQGSIPTTTTTTTTLIFGRAIDIAFDEANDTIVIMLGLGVFSVFYLAQNKASGLIPTNINTPLSIAAKTVYIRKIDKQKKVRIFVGSEMFLSDRWDSGEVETNLTAMYYGGGNNLTPGKTYYAHIQTYSDKYGWSELQIEEFVMPKYLKE